MKKQTTLATIIKKNEPSNINTWWNNSEKLSVYEIAAFEILSKQNDWDRSVNYLLDITSIETNHCLQNKTQAVALLISTILQLTQLEDYFKIIYSDKICSAINYY